MPKRIMITEYPVEYAPFNPPERKCFYGFPENSDLPDSSIPSMHYHSSYQIGVCLSGNGVFLLEDDIYAVKAGDAVIIAPDVIHCSKSIKRSNCNWDFVYFDPFEMRNRYPELTMPGSCICTQESEGELNSLLRKIIQEGKSCREDYERLASLYFYTFSILSLRNNALPEKSSEAEFIKNADETDIYNIMPALKEIAFRFDESIAVNELAKICNLSESHFTRIFKKCTGMSPYNYTLKFRAKVGAALLKSTDKTVNEISECVGFKNTSDFYRQFTKYYSCSPMDYRKK
ncbi:MAG: AraC family transcriptional regulator [Ruminococcaceae bacterium]|nr:AraC family transcriptional regulator [Oscillospiraceae bacterium]